MGISVLGLFFPNTNGVLKILSLGSVLVIFYSLFVQIFVEKTFCKVCLLIILVLISQMSLSFLFFETQISTSVFFLSLLLFSVVFTSLILINNLLSEKEKFRKENIKNLRFKRNYDLFKRELLENRTHIKLYKNVFFFGKKNAKLHISLVTNPYCGFCKDAHVIVEKLLRNPDISAQIRFNYFPENADENPGLLISIFKNIMENESEKALLEAINFWYEKKDIEVFKKKYSAFLNETDLSEIIEMAEENKANNLTFTPIFLINGYKFPEKYDREDIFYFLDDLLEDDLISN